MTRGFEDASASKWVAPGAYGYDVDEEWFGARGPHGGFLAGVLLKAMAAETGDSSRVPRSLTVHYAAPPKAGPSVIEVREERRGGRLSTVSARMLQDGQAMALALGAFSSPRPAAVEYLDAAPPTAVELPTDEQLSESRRSRGFGRHFDYVSVTGGEAWSGSAEARSGGWMRLRSAVAPGAGPVPVSAAMLAAFADAWLPALFTRVTERMYPPTIDLTVHFRCQTPVDGLLTSEWIYGEFSSKRAEGGFWEEDGELWSADGRLLAQSRQLALALPWTG